MGLRSDLQALSSNPFEDDQGTWRTFIIDHIPYLRSKAKTAYVDATYIDKYRYDLEWFLRQNGTGAEYIWIFRAINFLSSELDFDKEGVYYLVPMDEVQNLHDRYMSTVTPVAV